MPELETYSDEELMIMLQQQELDAFKTLVKRHTEKFYHLAYRIVFDKEEAQDIVQEAFIKVFKNPHNWRQSHKTKFTTWFYRVVSNQALDHKRKNKITEEYEDNLASKKNLEKTLHRKEQLAFIDQCLLDLAPRQRLALNLCFYHELSNKEAAEIMEIKIKALESLLSRAKAKLKKLAEDFYMIKEEIL